MNAVSIDFVPVAVVGLAIALVLFFFARRR